MPGKIIRGDLTVNGKTRLGEPGVNSAEFTAGSQAMLGTGKFTKRCQRLYYYQHATIAGTYNGRLLNAIPGVINLGGITYGSAFSDAVTAGPVGEVISMSFYLPEDYVAGTDLDIIQSRCATATSGNVVRGAGAQYHRDGQAFAGVPAYGAETAVTVPGTSQSRVDRAYTFSGVALQPGDMIDVALYRYADSGADTAAGYAMITLVKIGYTVSIISGM